MIQFIVLKKSVRKEKVTRITLTSIVGATLNAWFTVMHISLISVDYDLGHYSRPKAKPL